MAEFATPQILIPFALWLLGVGLAAWLLWRPADTPLRLQVWVVALLSALAPRWLRGTGSWVDMTPKAELAIMGLSLLMALLPRRLGGELAGLALAGFWLALGAASLRHATPLAPPLAAAALLFGAAVLLLPRARPAGLRQAGVLALLVGSAGYVLLGGGA